MDANPLVSSARRDETGTHDRGMALTLRLNEPMVGARGCSGGRLLGVCFSILLVGSPLLAIDRDRRLDELYHTSWTTKDGAPSEIFAIAQTEDGYLWLGTTTGLVRFDGIHFENYESPFGEALPAKNVMSLLAVPGEGLWIGFASGEVSLLKNGRITSYNQKDGLPPSSVRSMVRDRQGRIWAASLTRLSLFNGSQWRSIGADWNFSGGATAALVDHAGTIWIGTPDRVVFLSEGARRFQLAAEALKYVTSLSEDSHGTIWMSQLGGGVRPVRLSLPKLQVPTLKAFFDDHGSLWAPTLGMGLWRIPDPDWLNTGKPAILDSLAERYSHANGLTGEYTETIFQDSEGDIWVGTNGGIDRFRQSATTAIPSPSRPYMSLAPGERGTVWVAPTNYALRLVQDRRLLAKMPAELAQMRDRSASCIYRDAEGTLWMGTDPGLIRFAGLHLSRFPYPREKKPDADSRGAAITMTEARPAGLWVSFIGDAVYRFSDGNWTSLKALGGPQGIAMSSFTDPNGTVWLGFLDLTVVRIDDLGIRVFGAQDGVQVGKVRCIQGRDAKVWIGGDNGVAWFDGRRFRKLTPAGGSLRDVFGILETDEGLWFSENRGIIYVPRSELVAFEKGPNHPVRFRVLDFLDGVDAPLQRSAMNPALVQGSDGLLWFATTQGLVFIDPKRIPANMVRPPVSITSVVANSKPYTPTPGLALPDRVRNLEIDYIGISLAIPERVRYRYKLDGYDRDWQDPGTRRQAFYTNPGPGSYTFRVVAASPDGVRNESGATITFSIAPAFYETWWFRLLCALAAAGIVWLLYLLRLRLVTVQLQARHGERLLERERIARDLHDTLLQSFQGSLFEVQAARNLFSRRPVDAMQTLDEAIRSAEAAISEGRDAIRDLRSSSAATSDLAHLLATAGQELSEVAVSNGGSPAFSVTVEGQPQGIKAALQDEVYRLGREVLRNAFHHARAKKIEVEIRYDAEELRIRIRDDGIGVDSKVLNEGARPGHWGLPGVRERAKLVGAQLDFWSEASAGTEVQVTVPAAVAYGKSRGVGAFGFFGSHAD
jgi:ligand-binding sensor domain-containing protein/signal transduction histidine kinase